MCVCAIENPREAPVVHITPAPPTRELYRPPALGQAAAPVLSHQVPATFPASADDEACLLPTVPLCVSHTDHRHMYAHVHVRVYMCVCACGHQEEVRQRDSQSLKKRQLDDFLEEIKRCVALSLTHSLSLCLFQFV
jgi:hypothetical protein